MSELDLRQRVTGGHSLLQIAKDERKRSARIWGENLVRYVKKDEMT